MTGHGPDGEGSEPAREERAAGPAGRLWSLRSRRLVSAACGRKGFAPSPLSPASTPPGGRGLGLGVLLPSPPCGAPEEQSSPVTLPAGCS